MAVSGLQKLTVAAALVLCAALILPRLVLRRDTSEETGQGRFPPMMHRHVTPDLRGQRSAGVRGPGEVRGTGSGGAGSGGGGAGTGSGPGGKSNLAAQIIPVYGFGILLYILYILFKITSKGHSKPSQGRLHSLRSESSKRKITDFELSQLQERLRETELVMENLVNTSLQEEEDIAVSVSLDQEQTLLQQLTEITRAMKSNHLQDFTNTTEETETMDFDPFWSHCSCTCPETHEEEDHLEDQQTFEEEDHLGDQQTHEEEDHMEDQQTHEEEEDHLEDQQTHEEEEDHQTVPEGMSKEDQETKVETREIELKTEEKVLLKVQEAEAEAGDAEAGDTQLSERPPRQTRTMEKEELQSAADEEAERQTPEQQLNCGDVLQEETLSQASEEVHPGGGAAPSGVRRRNRRRRRRL